MTWEQPTRWRLSGREIKQPLSPTARVPARLHEKSRCEQLIADARTAVEDETTDKQRHIQLASDLQQALSMVGAAAYQQADAAGQAAPGDSHPPGASAEEDVVDAEFTER